MGGEDEGVGVGVGEGEGEGEQMLISLIVDGVQSETRVGAADPTASISHVLFCSATRAH